jgi:hypothetical protein
VLARAVSPGQSALAALRRSAAVETSYGGRFVRAIGGVAGSRERGRDWFYRINGIEASVGAADYTLRPGDQEWWDFRSWQDLLQIPIAVGAWPEPFVHGFDGARPRVRVGGLACAARVAAALRRAGARLTRRASPFTVNVTTTAAAPAALREWRRYGLTVALAQGAVAVYRPGRGAVPLPTARALIAAYRPGRTTGRSAALVVAGATPAAACAAASTLAARSAALARTYAVALDGRGRVIAAGGRP